MSLITIDKSDYQLYEKGDLTAAKQADTAPHSAVLVTIDVAAIMAEVRGIVEEVAPFFGGFLPVFAIAGVGGVGLLLAWAAVWLLR